MFQRPRSFLTFLISFLSSFFNWLLERVHMTWSASQSQSSSSSYIVPSICFLHPFSQFGFLMLSNTLEPSAWSAVRRKQGLNSRRPLTISINSGLNPLKISSICDLKLHYWSFLTQDKLVSSLKKLRWSEFCGPSSCSIFIIWSFWLMSVSSISSMG